MTQSLAPQAPAPRGRHTIYVEAPILISCFRVFFGVSLALLAALITYMQVIGLRFGLVANLFMYPLFGFAIFVCFSSPDVPFEITSSHIGEERYTPDCFLRVIRKIDHGLIASREWATVALVRPDGSERVLLGSQYGGIPKNKAATVLEQLTNHTGLRLVEGPHGQPPPKPHAGA